MLSPLFSFSLQWTYLVATYDGVIVRMYVNAKLVAQVRISRFVTPLENHSCEGLSPD